MRHTFSFFVLFIFTINLSIAQENLDGFFSETDKFLKTYTQNGRVNYVSIARNGADLKNLLDFIATVPANNFTADQKTAFYINTYNILVINLVIQSVKSSSNPSPKSIDGFF